MRSKAARLQRAAGFHGVVLHHFGDGGAEAREVFAQALEAAVVEIGGDEAAAILHQLGEVGGLAAGRGAEVEHGLAGLRREEIAGHERARVLHVAEPSRSQ